MAILLGVLTVLLVLNCIFLIMLVLIQLPKKEAGIGMAFGGGASETLFGAGSGTVLTKATKYSAALFMGLSLVLSIAGARSVRQERGSIESELQKRRDQPASLSVAPASTNPSPVLSPAPAPAAGTTAAPALLLTSTNALAPTNPAPQ